MLEKIKKNETLKRLVRNKPALAGGTIIFLLFIVLIFAPFVAPYSPFDQDLMQSLKPPSLAHPLGTDFYGRDVLSRIIFGSRWAIYIGAIAVGLSLFIGAIFGLIAGYYGGILDTIIQGMVDITWSFPAILAGLIISAILGAQLRNVFIAIALVAWAQYARLIRGEILSLKESEFVMAAQAAGSSARRIILKHMLPNAIAPILVIASLGMGRAIIIEASLSFLGLGAQPPTPTWGAMLNGGRTYLRMAPWVSLFPGLAIAAVVLALNLLGDGLRDALDPKLR